MSEALQSADDIIDAAELRMVEIGTEVGQRMLNGKDSVVLMTQGQKILAVKRAYHEGLENDEKEALLYCLRQLSEQYDVPAATLRNILGPIIPAAEEEEPFVDFYIGTLDDAEGFIGTAEDVENFIGTHEAS